MWLTFRSLDRVSISSKCEWISLNEPMLGQNKDNLISSKTDSPASKPSTGTQSPTCFYDKLPLLWYKLERLCHCLYTWFHSNSLHMDRRILSSFLYTPSDSHEWLNMMSHLCGSWSGPGPLKHLSGYWLNFTLVVGQTFTMSHRAASEQMTQDRGRNQFYDLGLGTHMVPF